MKMMAFNNARSLSLQALADLMTQAFSNYVAGRLTFDVEAFAEWLWREDAHLNLSQIAYIDQKAVGLAMMARRGNVSRLAAMGVAPDMQNQGIGKALFRHILNQARTRGDRKVVLECFEQNESGMRLYRGADFHTVRRLYGYRCDHLLARQSPWIEEVESAEVARQVELHGLADLPWQATGNALLKYGPPCAGFRLEQACTLLSDPRQPIVTIHALVVEKQAQGSGQARALLAGLAAKFPGKIWHVRTICPEEIGAAVFEKIGFRREPLHQVQMHKVLSP